MTDSLRRPATGDMFGAALGGRTDMGGQYRSPGIDWSVVDELLIAGEWIKIERGSVNGGTGTGTQMAWFGGPRTFFTFLRRDDETPCAVLPEMICGFSPFGIAEPPAPRVVTRPPPVEVPDDGAPVETITPEERHEALFLAADYEKAAARAAGDWRGMQFARMAEEQRRIAARPVREADPVEQLEAASAEP